MKKIGIFGGTFDPFTIAHREIVRKSLDIVDKIIIVPTTITYYRNSDVPPLFSFWRRMEIIDYACKGLDRERIIISSIEEKKSDTWRFIDTLEVIKNTWLDKDDEVYIIVGSDTFDKLDTWAESERITKKYKFIVAEGRGGKNSTNPLPHESIMIDNNMTSASNYRSRLTDFAENEYIMWMDEFIKREI